MAFDRTTIIRGPCKLTFDGATFYSKGGVVLTISPALYQKTTDAYGPVGQSKTDMLVTVEFEPVGEIESLAVLYALGNTAMGASIYGATDKPLVIVAVDSTTTILNAQITNLPSIRCTANNTAFGGMTFTGLLSNSGDPADVADYFTVGAGAAIGTAFNPALIVTAPYTATLGAVGPFYSEAGFEISFDLSLTPITVDGVGTVDMALESLGFSVSCIPTGLAQDAFDSLIDADIGGNVVSSALDISTATAGGLNFDAAGAEVTSLVRRFSPSENRLGQMTIVGKRTINAGAQVALFTVASV